MKFYFLFIIQFSIYASTCQQVSYSYLLNAKQVKQTKVFCQKDKLLYSKNCLDRACIDEEKLERLTLSLKHSLKLSGKTNEFGTLEFKLCKKLGGKPKIVTMDLNNKNIKTGLCDLGKAYFEATALLK